MQERKKIERYFEFEWVCWPFLVFRPADSKNSKELWLLYVFVVMSKWKFFSACFLIFPFQVKDFPYCIAEGIELTKVPFELWILNLQNNLPVTQVFGSFFSFTHFNCVRLALIKIFMLIKTGSMLCITAICSTNGCRSWQKWMLLSCKVDAQSKMVALKTFFPPKNYKT
jgi:hypothetical protein